MKRIFWLVLALGLGRAFGADPTTDYTWDSPDKQFRAIWSVNVAHDFSAFKIISLADPGARPLLEGGGDAPAPDAPNPPMVGVWSADGHHLAVYSVGKGQPGGYQLGAYIYGLQESGPNSPQRFVPVTNNARAYPVTLDTDVTDRLGSLQSDIGQMDFGAFQVNACRWKADHLVETDNQLNFTTESKSAHARFPYRAKWTITNRLADSGFAYVDISPISYTLLGADGKEGSWQTLPITDADRLRIAVRLNQSDAVSALLKKGVDPNKDPTVNLAALAAQVNGAQELGLLLKAQADINRNPTGRSWSMDSAILAHDPAILEEMLTGKPSAASDSSFDVYEILVSSLPRTEAYADTLGKYGPADDEAAFLRKLQLLSTAKYDINAADEKSGKTALILAVEAHLSTKLIQAMLAAGTDPDKKDGAGKSAADIAADTQQLPVLRLLDTGHHYAELLKSYEIPVNSPLVGTWTAGDDMYLTLSADGTGNVASMFASLLTWKEKHGVAEIEFHVVQANRPNAGFTGSAKLGAEKDTLVLTMNGPGRPLEETLHRDKSK